MAIFFFLVGLEIKREVVEGNLSSTDQIVFRARRLGRHGRAGADLQLLHLSDPLLAKGWAIPAATDIAFSLAALSLIGARVPPSLKVFSSRSPRSTIWARSSSSRCSTRRSCPPSRLPDRPSCSGSCSC
ncbi:MAG: Na+/H+ antiporter NhaA [Hyphomicrobiales bacterium]